MGNKEHYSITEVAKLLGISRVAVFKKIKRGKIKAKKIGHIYAIPKEEFGAVLDETLTAQQKKIIKAGVKKTIQDYGEVLEKLGRE